MRILSTVIHHYYNRPDAIEPMYLEFTQPLVKLGHTVDHFDHVNTSAQFGQAVCGDQFVQKVKAGGYDVVLYQTGGADWMNREAISEAKRYAPVIAFNSDDDWQWESYTRQIYPYFTFMATTYPHIYDANVKAYPNLLLTQWGCLDTYADFGRAKDWDFSFVGQIYGSRQTECRHLLKAAGLRVFGMGAGAVMHPVLYRFLSRRPIRPVARRLPILSGIIKDRTLGSIQEVNDVWNRSKISYTPLGSSASPAILQIKGRIFQMGLSGTLMLCQHRPGLERYYEPGKEFVVYHDLKDCAEKVRYLLEHEPERAAIAEAYRRRTQAEHLWQHRFERLFRDAGVGQKG